MKKSIKVSLIISGVLILLGMIVVVITSAFGGKELLRNAIANNEFDLIHYGNDAYFDRFDWDWGWNHDGSYWYDNEWINSDIDDGDDWKNDGKKEYTGNFSGVEIADISEVSDLKIKIGAAALTVVESSEDGIIRMEGNIKGLVKCYVENGTLFLKNNRRRLYKNYKDEITLYIPENTMFQNVEITAGAGEIIMEQLKAVNVDAKIGAGRIECINLDAEEISADIGVGEFEVENGIVQNGDFIIGVGSMTYGGEIRGDLEAECSVGSAEFNLREEERLHNYDVSASLGSVQVGGSNYSSLSNDIWIDNNVDSTYSFESSLGSIVVDFE